MKKNTLIAGILFLVLVIIAIILISKDKNSLIVDIPEKKDDIILFYGIGCPHCLIVDNYIEENKIEERMSFEHLEIYYNKSNSNLLAEKASACGLNTNRIGVPLLWENNRCFIGDRQIIEFLDNKIRELDFFQENHSTTGIE